MGIIHRLDGVRVDDCPPCLTLLALFGSERIDSDSVQAYSKSESRSSSTIGFLSSDRIIMQLFPHGGHTFVLLLTAVHVAGLIWANNCERTVFTQ